MAKKRDIVAGLDIGTQKVALIIAEPTAEGMEILGVGVAGSRGIRAGRVCDVDKTMAAIQVALSEAEVMSGCQVHRVTVAVSGDHVHGTNSHGVAPIENGEVSARAARRVIEAAQAVPLLADQSILHLLCREYVIDGQGGIVDPVGMSGVRLQANLHVISACESTLGNITKCCNKAGLSVDDVIAAPLGSAAATLDPEEKDLGVAILDIGAGTADLAVYQGGAVVHTSVSPVAGLYVTRDLAHCLETSMSEAETLKKRHGSTLPSQIESHLSVEVSGVRGREPRVVKCRLVAEIIEPRIEEILETAAESLIRSGYADYMTSGIVLTGGTAMLPGITEVAARIFGRTVRVGEPQGVEGLAGEIDDPSWATAVGLLLGPPETDMAAPLKSSGLAGRMMPRWIQRSWKSVRS